MTGFCPFLSNNNEFILMVYPLSERNLYSLSEGKRPVGRPNSKRTGFSRHYYFQMRSWVWHFWDPQRMRKRRMDRSVCVLSVQLVSSIYIFLLLFAWIISRLYDLILPFQFLGIVVNTWYSSNWNKINDTKYRYIPSLSFLSDSK